MTSSQNSILGRTAWTIGSYGISLCLRLGSNVVLSRILAPELIGVVVVVNTIKVGVELFSDLGIEQNIVGNRSGDTDQFINTAWTIQVLRGLFLSTLFLCISPMLARFYGIDLSVFLIIAFSPFLNSLASTSVFILVKNLDVRKRSLFEITSEVLSFAATISLALLWQNVWAVVVGALLSVGIRSALSHFLPHPPHRLTLVGKHVWEIIGFGKWIMLSSLLMYASSQIDKIYLGKAVPLEIFGIYGLARTISDLPSILANKLSFQVLFPLLSASKHLGSTAVVKTLAPSRAKLLLLACLGVSVGIAFADYAVMILYDARYYDAGWMLCLLLFGAWFAVLSGLNEAVLLSEKPVYHSISNTVRLIVIVIGLVVGTPLYGIEGAIVAVGASEISRYVTLAFGQYRVKFSFIGQDAFFTLLLAVIVAGLTLLRLHFGFGTALGNLPD